MTPFSFPLLSRFLSRHLAIYRILSFSFFMLFSASPYPVGDIVSISGVFLPVRYQGFRAMKAGLIADTFLQAQHIFRHKKGYDEWAQILRILYIIVFVIGRKPTSHSAVYCRETNIS